MLHHLGTHHFVFGAIIFGMAFHLAAWSQSVQQAGAFVAINAVTDAVLTISPASGTSILVPGLNKVIALAAGVETTAAQQARLTAPSRRILALQRIAPTQGNAAAASLPGNPHRLLWYGATPITMITGEAAQIELNATPAAPQIQWGLVWFTDGVVAPANGPAFTIRATGATALVAQAWTLVPLTFSENLPRGRYQVVGMRAQSTNLVAARLVFAGTGSQGPWRPGVLGSNSDSHLDHPAFRYGPPPDFGSFGEFEDTSPPAIECLATAADAAETFYLDLVQERAGPA